MFWSICNNVAANFNSQKNSFRLLAFAGVVELDIFQRIERKKKIKQVLKNQD